MFLFLLAIVIAILFHSIGLKINKSPWFFSLLGVVVYFIPSFGLYFFSSLEFSSTGSFIVSSFEQFAVLSGLFLCYVFRFILINKSKKNEYETNEDIIDDIVINEGSKD